MKDLSVNDRIMETATRLFYTQGYNLTGINQIIDEAGIAKASLYSHYHSKTDLLLAYLDNQSMVFYGELETFLKDIKDPRKKILGIFDYHILIYQKYDFGGCPFLKIKDEVTSTEKTVLDRVLGNKNRLRELFHTLVLQLDQKTGLPDKDLSNMLFFMLEGATVSASITKNIDDIKSATKTVKKFI